jgi:hypothetical protein
MRRFKILMSVVFVFLTLVSLGYALEVPEQAPGQWAVCGVKFVGECSFLPCQKTYIASSQIHIVHNEIWIELEDTCLKTSAIYSDSTGVFFQDASDCSRGEWWCPRCEVCRKTWYTLCLKCGYLQQ